MIALIACRGESGSSRAAADAAARAVPDAATRAVDAAAPAPRRALPAVPIAADGAALPHAAITLGSDRFRLPDGIYHLRAIGGRVIAVTYEGGVSSVDPDSGEVQKVTQLSGSARAIAVRGDAMIVAHTPTYGGTDIAVRVDVATGATTTERSADVAWGDDILGDELLVHDVLSDTVRTIDLASGRERALSGFTASELLRMRLLAGHVLVEGDDGVPTIADRRGKRRVRLPSAPYRLVWRTLDGKRIAFALDQPSATDYGPEEIAIWDVARRKEVRRLAIDNPLTGFAWLEDGGYVVGQMNGGLVRFDAKGARVAAIDLGAQMITEIVELPGRLAVATTANVIRIVDLATFTAASPGAGHLGSADAFVVIGDRLVSIGMDGTARIWDLATGREVVVVALPDTDTPLDLVATPGNATFEVLSTMGEIAVIEVYGLDGARLRRIEWSAHLTAFSQVAPQPMGGHVVVSTGQRWEIDAAGVASAPTALDGNGWNVALAAHTLAVGTESGARIGSARVSTRECQRLVELAVAARGDSVLVVDAAPTLSLWSSFGVVIAAIQPPLPTGVFAAIGADPPIVAVVADANVLLWEVGRRTVTTAPIGPLGEIVVTDDGWLVGAAHGGRIGVWDIEALRATGSTEPAVPVRALDGACRP